MPEPQADSDDEVAELAVSFNKMAGSMQSLIDKGEGRRAENAKSRSAPSSGADSAPFSL